MDTPKVVAGIALVVASTAILFAGSSVSLSESIPPALLGLAALGLAVGTLLYGIAGSDGRPV